MARRHVLGSLGLFFLDCLDIHQRTAGCATSSSCSNDWRLRLHRRPGWLFTFLKQHISYISTETGIGIFSTSHSPCFLRMANARSLIGWFKTMSAKPGRPADVASWKNRVGSHSMIDLISSVLNAVLFFCSFLAVTTIIKSILDNRPSRAGLTYLTSIVQPQAATSKAKSDAQKSNSSNFLRSGRLFPCFLSLRCLPSSTSNSLYLCIFYLPYSVSLCVCFLFPPLALFLSRHVPTGFKSHPPRSSRRCCPRSGSR